jgi:hypothetical protein
MVLLVVIYFSHPLWMGYELKCNPHEKDAPDEIA